MGLFSPSMRSGRKREEEKKKREAELKKEREAQAQAVAQEKFTNQFEKAQEIAKEPEKYGFTSQTKGDKQVLSKNTTEEYGRNRKDTSTLPVESIRYVLSNGVPTEYSRKEYNRGVLRFQTRYDFSTGLYADRQRNPDFSANISANKPKNKNLFIYTKGKRESGRYVSQKELNEITATKQRTPQEVYNKVDITFTKTGIKGDLSALTKEQQQDVGRQYVSWQKSLNRPLTGRAKIEAQTASFSATRQSSAYNNPVFRIQEQFKPAPEPFSIYTNAKIKVGNRVADIGREAKKYTIVDKYVAKGIDTLRTTESKVLGKARYFIPGTGPMSYLLDKTNIKSLTIAQAGSYFVPIYGTTRFVTEGTAYAVTGARALLYDGKEREMFKQNKGEAVFLGAVYASPLIFKGAKGAYKYAKSKYLSFKLNSAYRGQIVTRENLGEIARITKQPSTLFRTREVLGYQAKATTMTGASGSTSKASLTLKLGKPQYIQGSNIPTGKDVLLSGYKVTAYLSGTRGNIVSKPTKALLKDGELTYQSGQAIFREGATQSSLSLRDFAKIFENTKSVRTAPGSVSTLTTKFKGSILSAKSVEVSTRNSPIAIKQIQQASGGVSLIQQAPQQPATVLKLNFIKPKKQYYDFFRYPVANVGTRQSGKSLSAVFSETYELQQGTGRALFVYDRIINPKNVNPFATMFTPKPQATKAFGTIKTVAGDITIRPRKTFSTVTGDKPLSPGESLQADGTVTKLKTPQQQTTKQETKTVSKYKSANKQQQQSQQQSKQQQQQQQPQKPVVFESQRFSANIKVRQRQSQRSGTRLKPLVAFDISQAQQQGFSVAQQQAQSQQQSQAQDVGTMQTSILSTAQQSAQDVSQRQSQQSFSPSFRVPTFRTKIKYVQETQMDPFKANFPKIPQSDKKNNEGYNVLIRKKGKFSIANAGPLSKEQAVQFGAFVVGNTASASFKTVKTGTQATGRFSGRGELKDFNIKNGVYIEKRSRRIKSVGELQEITLQGIRATKNKKRSPGFNLFGKNPFKKTKFKGFKL